MVSTSKSEDKWNHVSKLFCVVNIAYGMHVGVSAASF